MRAPTFVPARRRRLEVLAASRRERVCRACGMPLTWFETYLRPRRAVALEYAPRIVETSRGLDDGADVCIVDHVHVHQCPARTATRRGGRRAH